MQPRVMLKQLKLQGLYPTHDSKINNITDSHLFLPSRTEPITIRLTPIPHVVQSPRYQTPILPNTWNTQGTMHTQDERQIINNTSTHGIDTPLDTQQFTSYMFHVQESQDTQHHTDYEALPLHVKFFGYLPTLHP